MTSMAMASPFDIASSVTKYEAAIEFEGNPRTRKLFRELAGLGHRMPPLSSATLTW